MLAAWASACKPSPASDSDGDVSGIVVTQRPSDASAPWAVDRLSPAERYPTGTRVVFVPAGGGPGDVRVLSQSLAAAGAPDVSPQANSVLFTGRRQDRSHWVILEAKLPDLSPRVLVETNRDCTQPAYLAHGRLIFACSNAAADSSFAAGWSLYTAAGDGSGAKPITFGPGSAFDPTPLRDGRVLFSMWQSTGTGRPSPGGSGLFTVNPDGTMLEPFAGSHRLPAHKVRARQTGDGGVVYVAVGENTAPAHIERVEMKRPQAKPSILFPRPRPEDSALVSFVPGAVEPLPENGYILAALPRALGSDSTWGIFRALPDGSSLESVFDDESWDEIEVAPLVRTPEPKGRPSPVRRGARTGSVLCYDSRRSDGIVGPPAGVQPAVVAVDALEVAVSGEPPQGGAQTWPVAAPPGSRRQVELGEAPVESDGSFFLEVPADTPIRVRTLDSHGREIATSAWFWVRPGEVRSCFGCHENREAAPVNRFVAATSHSPVRLEDSAGRKKAVL